MAWFSPTVASTQPVHRLELRLRELAQLFNSLDPAPFVDRDLAREAEPETLITESIHHYFAYKGELARRCAWS
ncbi:MAG TPA: hypothetical protein VI229_03965 [Burkholderiales bacterium]